ncbi:MAG: peptidyl-prolyl cis-trans isomerase, partial [Muribaculaceae bacterium]|nr:peptidyl-prolyl cis-trans isomerase [Muribaculaceae bacterium]
GYHVLRFNARRPDKGEVLVSHILKLFQGDRNPATEAQAKAAIDSIYTLVTAPEADFGAIAAAQSEDPGSARNNGQLPWFGAGRMVPEFENVAFALADGEISKPFASQFGYHIIKRLDSRKPGSFAQEQASLAEAIKADPERSGRAKAAKLEQLKKKYNAQINAKTLAMIKEEIQRHGSYDSIVAAALANDKAPLLSNNVETLTVGEYFARGPIFGDVESETAINRIDAGTAEVLDEMTLEAEKRFLENTNREFRNLVNEYRDGMMLFEISNSKVWDRSSKDTEGLETYFKTNASKYTFDTPRYKGFLISATSDSIITAVDQYLATNTIDQDSLGVELRRLFPRNIKVERVVLPAGVNEIIDAVAFGAPAPDLT